MSEVVKFKIKWLENAVKKALKKRKGELTKEDIETIKYLRVLEPFNNDKSLEISVQEPPIPFCDFNGGDEWEYCCAFKDRIDKVINNDFSFGFDKENNTFSKDSLASWKEFKKSIKKYDENVETEQDYLNRMAEERKQREEKFKIFSEIFNRKKAEYKEKTGEPITPQVREILEAEAQKEVYVCGTPKAKRIDEKESSWSDAPCEELIEDLRKFKNIKVLRLVGLGIENYEFLNDYSDLKVLELVEMASPYGVENKLRNLEQLCIWND